MSAGEDNRTESPELKTTLRDLISLYTAFRVSSRPSSATHAIVSPAWSTNLTLIATAISAANAGRHEKSRSHDQLRTWTRSDTIVKGIEPTGYLRFDRIGGAGDGLLGCRKVEVNGRFGLIGSISGHLGSAEMLALVTPISELYIDVGASSAAEVASSVSGLEIP